MDTSSEKAEAFNRITLNEISDAFAKSRFVVKKHCQERFEERLFTISDLIYSLGNAEIIEYYPPDGDSNSALVCGRTSAGRYIHFVVVIDDGVLSIITVYEPDLEHFNPDMKTRRNNHEML